MGTVATFSVSHTHTGTTGAYRDFTVYRDCACVKLPVFDMNMFCRALELFLTWTPCADGDEVIGHMHAVEWCVTR